MRFKIANAVDMNAFAILNEAEAHISAGEYDSALAILNEAIRNKPNEHLYQYYDLRGHAYTKMEERPFGGPEAVLAYLSRYTHRIAIANSRLIAFDQQGVTFRWKDFASNPIMQMLTFLAETPTSTRATSTAPSRISNRHPGSLRITMTRAPGASRASMPARCFSPRHTARAL
jgi:hypothetical protein